MAVAGVSSASEPCAGSGTYGGTIITAANIVESTHNLRRPPSLVDTKVADDVRHPNLHLVLDRQCANCVNGLSDRRTGDNGRTDRIRRTQNH